MLKFACCTEFLLGKIISKTQERQIFIIPLCQIICWVKEERKLKYATKENWVKTDEGSRDEIKSAKIC